MERLKDVWDFLSKLPTAFVVREGSRMGMGSRKLPREQRPMKPPRIALVLPLNTLISTQVQTSLLFPWISQAKLGALTRNFPRKRLTTRRKHKDIQRHAQVSYAQ